MEYIIWLFYLPIVIICYSFLARIILKDSTAESFLAVALSSFLAASTLEIVLRLSPLRIVALAAILNVGLYHVYRHYFQAMAAQWVVLLVIASNVALFAITAKYNANIAVVMCALQLFFFLVVHRLAKMPHGILPLGLFAASITVSVTTVVLIIKKAFTLF